ncbi:unnamed protein product (macronuclear) [Paramecium tetraurelia]|uniref:Centrosomal protein of 162 kDa n=1 Tax=Paramecium tetraurelia TaxID=5888 RepID=A0DKE6_PARTE|nr:uncharacterized protein GSPATT00017842001 [Paramecium tetraurelia]CAK83513.1 unnamed protein product [Paramecium tetraurelia]|eukprot:XP_001450910.1 hypothetical protein (macronuclear) [Paramecium tetraurelia strain d4-2]
MFQREQRNTTNSGYKSSSNAYVMAMKALQEKIKLMETQKNHLQPCNKMKINDEENLSQQIQELRNQNETLSIQLQRQQNDKENINNYILQIEALQQERLIQLKEYQDRVADLVKKIEDGKKERSEMQSQIDQLQKQLEQYKLNERGLMQKVDQQKLDENQKQIEQILDLKHRLEQGQTYAKKLEKRYEKLQNEKNQLESNYLDYRERCPIFKLQEYEKQIQIYRGQLEEKERAFLRMMEEIQNQRQSTEDQLTRRIQELLNKSNEYQSKIHKLTIELKDLSLKHQQLQLRMEYEEKNNKFNRKRLRNVSSSEDPDQDMPIHNPTQQQINNHNQKVAKLNFEYLQPQMSSPRFEQSLVKSNVLKQAIKDCLEDMKQTTPFKSDLHFQADQSLLQQHSKKKLLSPPMSARNNETEYQLKQLNDRYEQLIRQAQKESDFKQKAQIRKELLDIAEQIKDINRKQ